MLEVTAVWTSFNDGLNSFDSLSICYFLSTAPAITYIKAAYEVSLFGRLHSLCTCAVTLTSRHMICIYLIHIWVSVGYWELSVAVNAWFLFDKLLVCATPTWLLKTRYIPILQDRFIVIELYVTHGIIPAKEVIYSQTRKKYCFYFQTALMKPTLSYSYRQNVNS